MNICVRLLKNSIPIASVLAVGLSLKPTPSALALTTDIVFLVDESGSMSGEHACLI